VEGKKKGKKKRERGERLMLVNLGSPFKSNDDRGIPQEKRGGAFPTPSFTKKKDNVPMLASSLNI